MLDTDRARLDERYLSALSTREFGTLRSIFAPHIRFRALVPGGLREANGVEETIAMIEGWYRECDTVDVVASSISHAADRAGIAYRLRVHENGRWYIIGQDVFYALEAGKIAAMDLLCSGFRPEENRLDSN
ncbi:MAG: nuclear transport factor 2 family protein [Candidatus Eremiobacteraeota bacterium]|nr:nuclear transport factor 2 family protein [Candidatus Eremiobacteraeota bacterium]